MKRKIKINIFICIGTLLFMFFTVFPNIIKEFRKVRLHVAYETLKVELMQELNDYYKRNHRYPDSINELTNIDYYEGSTPEMLSDFNYVTDGNSCNLSYFSNHYGQAINLHMVEGAFKVKHQE